MNTILRLQAALLLIGGILLSSCSTTKNTTSQNIDEKLKPTLLWEITGKKLKKPSYLFGTIHLIPAEDFFMPDAVKVKMNECKKLTTEVDLSKQMEILVASMSHAPMKNGVKLADLLNEEHYSKVKSYFENEVKEIKMIGFGMFETWKPMLLTSLLYEKMINGPTKSYEMELLAIGQRQKMKFSGLETLEYQMSVFDAIPYKEQAESLYEMIISIENGEEDNEFTKIVEAYKTQDVDKMYEFSVEEEDMENFEDALLTTRNKNWIPIIIEQAQEEPTFFAVGAAHLGGPNGVIRLLKNQGLQLKPILMN